MYSDVTAPGRALHHRFLALGDMTGKTADEIVAAVGRPNSVSSMASGSALLQWQATGCHMALLFGPDGKLVKITHQFANYTAAPTGCMMVVTLALVVLAAVAAVALQH